MNTTILMMDVQQMQDTVIRHDDRMRRPLLRMDMHGDGREEFPFSIVLDPDTLQTPGQVLEEDHVPPATAGGGRGGSKAAAQSAGGVDGDVIIIILLSLEGNFGPLILVGVELVAFEGVVRVDAEDASLEKDQ